MTIAQGKRPKERRARANELILQGYRKNEFKPILQEEFGITAKSAQGEYLAARKRCLKSLTHASEQRKVAEAMWMGGYRKSRIVDALLENWDEDSDLYREKKCNALSEDEAELIVDRAVVSIDAETAKTKEEKRNRLSLWFEDKMMNAAKDRDALRAAALMMRLEGLADQSEFEAPTSDVTVELGDWRQGFKEQLAEGKTATASPVETPK